MVIIRTLDPYYLFLLQQTIYELFGHIKDEPEEGIQAQVLSSFLASSLNIELVYIILAGITKFSASGSAISIGGAQNEEGDEDEVAGEPKLSQEYNGPY